MKTELYDVIIIGGGASGTACAALLSKWGLRVLLVEKNKVPILDTMTTWIDSFFDLFDYVTGSKKSQK